MHHAAVVILALLRRVDGHPAVGFHLLAAVTIHRWRRATRSNKSGSTYLTNFSRPQRNPPLPTSAVAAGATAFMPGFDGTLVTSPAAFALHVDSMLGVVIDAVGLRLVYQKGSFFNLGELIPQTPSKVRTPFIPVHSTGYSGCILIKKRKTPRLRSLEPRSSISYVSSLFKAPIDNPSANQSTFVPHAFFIFPSQVTLPWRFFTTHLRPG